MKAGLKYALVFLAYVSSASSTEIYTSFSNRFPSENVNPVAHGDSINLMSAGVSWQAVVDINVPESNGLDLKLSRSYRDYNSFNYHQLLGNNWTFDVPTIVIPTGPRTQKHEGIIEICSSPFPYIEQVSYNGRFNGEAASMQRYWNAPQLRIPGQADQQLLSNFNTDPARFPNEEPWITVDGWVASCSDDNKAFIVKSPKGEEYLFDVIGYEPGDPLNGSTPGHWVIRGSTVTDKFGQQITYNYKTFTEDFHLSQNGNRLDNSEYYIRSNLLDSIVSASGKIQLTYNFDNSNNITAAYYAGVQEEKYQEVKYELTAAKDFKSVTKGGLKWEYKHEGEPVVLGYSSKGIQYGARRISQYKSPYGLTIDYDYDVPTNSSQLLRHEFFVYPRLSERIIKSGSKVIESRTYDYEDLSDGIHMEVTIDINSGNKKEVHKIQNNYATKHGRLKSLTVHGDYNGDVPGTTKVTTFDYIDSGEIGNYRYLNSPRLIPSSARTILKLTEKIEVLDGTTYTTEYLEHDLFGRITKIKESNTGNELTKYTKQNYMNLTDNWILGLPTKTSVSSTDNNEDYVTTREIVYHSSATSEEYKALGLPYEEKEFGRWTKRFTEYHADGNLKKVEFNVGRTTGSGNRFLEFTDYKHGLPQTVTRPVRDGTGTVSQTRVVDDNGWITQLTDFNGTPTNYGFDDLGRLTWVDYKNETNFGDGYGQWKDRVFTWSTDSAGNPVRTEQFCRLVDDSCDENSIAFTRVESYDGLMRLEQIQETDSSKTRFRIFNYNSSGLQSFDTRWIGTDVGPHQGVITKYDALDRVISMSRPGMGEVTYEYLAGSKIKATDAGKNIDNEKHETTTTYLTYGTPSYELATKIEAPENVTTDIQIDIFGLVESVIQSGKDDDGNNISLTETRLYDDYKKLCLVKRKDVGNTLYNKNAIGETNWMAQGVSNNDCTATKPTNGTAITYTLDNTGDVKKIDYDDINAPDVTYLRDENGNITQLTSGTVVHTYNYNNQNLLEDETFVIGSSKALQLDYGYSDMMYRNFIAYPDGMTVFANPNGFGQPTEARTYSGSEVLDTFVSDVEYYSSGELYKFTYGNGIKHETKLNQSLLPEQIKDVHGSDTVMDLSYTFDNNANITSITDGHSNIYSLTNLSYDGLNRLISTTGNAGIGSSAIRYDSLGNISYYSSKDSILDYTYNYSTNRLTKVVGTGSKSKSYSSFGYDDRGNITHNGHDGLNFNLANQLYSTADGNEYLYDGFNRRVKQQDHNGKTSYSMYSQDGMLLYREIDVSNGQGNGINYIYLGQKLVAKALDRSPQNNSLQRHKAYGETLQTPKDDIGYAKHKFDTDINLSYMQARYYDPIIGRFYSNDPVDSLGHLAEGNLHGFNRYAYANNNPYKYIDPDGQKSDFWWTEPKKRHEDAVNRLSNRLRKQGLSVDTEVRFEVTDENGNKSIRIMDIVATDKQGNISLIEVKTFASKEEGTLEKASKKTLPGKALAVGDVGIRGAEWYFQMVKDANISEFGAKNLRTGEKIGPTSVFWHGFRKKGSGFKAYPSFPITK